MEESEHVPGNNVVNIPRANQDVDFASEVLVLDIGDKLTCQVIFDRELLRFWSSAHATNLAFAVFCG